MFPILTVLVPVLPLAERETLPTASTRTWFPYANAVHVPLLYVPLWYVNVEKDGFEYDWNVTAFDAEFVLPRESVAVTVAVLDPAAKALEDVTSAPVAVKALLTAYEEIDAPDPAVAELTTLNFVYPPT